MAVDQTQKQRFELRYLIDEETALLVRDFVRAYLDFDEYCAGRSGSSYPVHSLYLDSENSELLRDAIDGKQNRYKLRLRRYGASSDVPVFFEIKRRTWHSVFKSRCRVRPDRVQILLETKLAQPDSLVSPLPADLVSLQNFCRLASQIRARPAVHIFLHREAYQSHDGQTRVTLDRDMRRSSHCEISDRSPDAQEAQPVFSRATVVLKLKFINRFPEWFRDIIPLLGLREG